MAQIDWERLAAAIAFYQTRGYVYVEVPWLVSKASVDVTRPPTARSFDTFAGALVASGEQSLLEVWDALKPDTPYVCATPCFRDETVDELHLTSFFKVELMWVKPKAPDERLFRTVTDAAAFFGTYATTELVTTDIGLDLLLNGVEIGSYGVRTFDNGQWVYGTGCAEPRFSQALTRGWR